MHVLSKRAAYIERSSTLPENIKECGTKLIVELFNYRDDNGYFPETLEELREHGYTPVICSPEWGTNEWHYARYTDRDFFELVVYYEDRSPELILYNSSKQAWTYLD